MFRMAFRLRDMGDHRRNGSTADGWPSEVELKLAGPPDALLAIERLPWLLLRAEKRTTRRLVSTYFDTPDLRLHERGLALRIRRVGRRRIQTLKTARDRHAVVAGRGEWEVDVGTDTPDLAAFADRRVLALAGDMPAGGLGPIFETRIRRLAMQIVWPTAGSADARIEIALDRGEVVAGGQRLPISQIELELLDGPAGALLELAVALRREAPLRISRLDKAAMGYGLAAGVPPAHTKAGRLRLDPSRTVEDAMRAVFQHCLAHGLANESVVVDGRNLEGVHQLRVAMRRLRSALTIFAPLLPSEQQARWKGEARWLLGTLGKSRDLDVVLTELLPEVVAAGGADASLEMFRRAAADRSETARAEARQALASQRAGDFLLDFASWVQRYGWREPGDAERARSGRESVAAFAARAVAHRFRKLRKAGRGFAGLDPLARHRVRVQAKKLRYGLEFFAHALAAPEAERQLAGLTRLLDLLGRRNDIAVVGRLVDDLVDAAPPAVRPAIARAGGMLLGWHAHAAAAMEKKTVRAWRAVKALDPHRLAGS